MTSTTPDTTVHPPDSTDHAAPLDIGAVLARGAVAGLAGGLLFALASMWYADAHGKPPIAPFLDISTIFHGTDMPVINANDVIAGLVTHLALSLLFGIVFGLAVAMLRLAQRPTLLLMAGLIYGLALYVVNFQIIGRALFPWFVNAKGPNQIFELWIHPVAYGLILVPFFLGFRTTARR